MINKTTQISQSTGDINYLVIEYLKSIPFNDNNKKEQLIQKVSKYIFNNKIFIFVLLCYD
jgi:hypothetical protein